VTSRRTPRVWNRSTEPEFCTGSTSLVPARRTPPKPGPFLIYTEGLAKHWLWLAPPDAVPPTLLAIADEVIE
jgi:hypothetical protein